MKKVFMCVNYPKYNAAIGISKKIQTQIESFKKIGYEVTYSAYSTEGIDIYCDDILLRSYHFNRSLPAKVNNVLRSSLLMKACRDYLLKTQEHYELGFIRWNALTNRYVATTEALDEFCDYVIMDCHGYHPSYNPNTVKGKYIQLFTKLNSPKMHNYIDLCLLEAKDRSVWGIPAMPIDTGIDVDAYSPHSYCGNNNDIRLISVANELPYHGYDRIIKGIANYKGHRNVHLNLVGKMSKKTVELVKKLGIEDQVTFHGYQTGEALKHIYEDSNLGVGPLAPHRIGGKQGTGIKTKEYFAIGLPYFFAGQELLVPDQFPFVCRCEADDSPINMETIIKFYDSIKDKQDIAETMIGFARENYSWPKMFLKAEALLSMN